jgi:mannose-6-phosphate isomerase class I
VIPTRQSSPHIPSSTGSVDGDLQEQASPSTVHLSIGSVKTRLCDSGGGYEIVYDSPWLQIGVYALCAPEPDQQRTSCNNALFVVLEGRGLLDVDGKELELLEADAAFVPAGAKYRFSSYEQLSVVVISQQDRGDGQMRHPGSPTKSRSTPG